MAECGEGRQFMDSRVQRAEGSEGLCSSQDRAWDMCLRLTYLRSLLQTQPHQQPSPNARFWPWRTLRRPRGRARGASESHASAPSRCESDALGLQSTAPAVASVRVADGRWRCSRAGGAGSRSTPRASSRGPLREKAFAGGPKRVVSLEPAWAGPLGSWSTAVVGSLQGKSGAV